MKEAVLIPSSSGQSFNLTAQGVFHDLEVLIPSSSGQSFNFGEISRGELGGS